MLRNAEANGDITSARRAALADEYLQNAIKPELVLASTDGGTAATPGSSAFRAFYIQYLDTHYPNVFPTEDSAYTRSRDSYTLRAYQKAFGGKTDAWNPELGFAANEQFIRKLYDYYQATFMAKPDEFLWAGLGRMAGGAVLGGLLMPGVPDPSFLTDTMVLIGKAIFHDLAWQHELYLDDPSKAIAMATEHDKRYPAHASYQAAWTKIASGKAADIAAGNRMLLENEQFTIIQPLYDQIKQTAEWFSPLFFSETSAFTQNIHPYHRPFAESFPTARNADITVAADRWDWITMTDGMYDKWVQIPAAERSRLVGLPMSALLARSFAPVLPAFVPPGGP